MTTIMKPITRLPDFLKICGMCNGSGQYDQSYYIGINPDRPYSTMRGPCEVCCNGHFMLEGPGFVFKDGTRVTESIIAQVLTLNGIDTAPRDWLRDRTLAIPAPPPITLAAPADPDQLP